MHVHTDVPPELPVDVVEASGALARSFAPDVIVGYGGGSALDAAKLIALLVSHGGSLSAYYGENAVPGPVVPLVAIPTTAGTGSEVTPVAVVSDPARDLKVGVSSPFLVPRVGDRRPRAVDRRSEGRHRPLRHRRLRARRRVLHRGIPRTRPWRPPAGLRRPQRAHRPALARGGRRDLPLSADGRRQPRRPRRARGDGVRQPAGRDRVRVGRHPPVATRSSTRSGR